tara:strand:+ start:678 stop:896 length:219 start_codon:yes stop_codon:yes gene_type:complete
MKKNNTACRISELEQQLAHQENTIEELNVSVVKQWQTIKNLEDKLLYLQDRLLSIETGQSLKGLKDELPPHY